MKPRIAYWVWPLLAALSPLVAALLLAKGLRYRRNLAEVERRNTERMDQAGQLDLPELEKLELVVLSEFLVEEGFSGEAGVSYLLDGGQGQVLFDVGFGPEVMSNNARRLGVTLEGVEALVISHLHPDHMGGSMAVRRRSVALPDLGLRSPLPCFLPDQASADHHENHVVAGPLLLPGGLATTGPLARSLYFFGWTEEQALVARLRGKGLVVISGCGHPTLQVILAMVRRLSDEPIHAVIGGFHFPVTGGRLRLPGWDAQTMLGTGKPPWQRITDEDLTAAIQALREAAPRRVLLSAHDSCDHALERFSSELDAEVELLRAGGRYTL